MGRSRNLKIAAVLIVVAVATPSQTLATTGGVGLPGTTPSATTAAVANQLVTVNGEGITVSGHTEVLLSGRLWLKAKPVDRSNKWACSMFNVTSIMVVDFVWEACSLSEAACAMHCQ